MNALFLLLSVLACALCAAHQQEINECYVALAGDVSKTAPAAMAASRRGCWLRTQQSGAKLKLMAQKEKNVDMMLFLANMYTAKVNGLKAGMADPKWDQLWISSKDIPLTHTEGTIMGYFVPSWPTVTTKVGFNILSNTDSGAESIAIDGEVHVASTSELDLSSVVPRGYILNSEGIRAFEADFRRTQSFAQSCLDGKCTYPKVNQVGVQKQQPVLDHSALWVLKPLHGYGGGSELAFFSSLDDSNYQYARSNPGTSVVQKYVAHGEQENGRVVDYKLSIMVTALDPLTVYLSDTMLRRTAADSTGEGRCSLCTSRALLLQCEGDATESLVYAGGMDGEGEEVQGNSEDEALQTVREAAMRAVQMIPPKYHRPDSFELMQVDVVLDESNNAWVIDIQEGIYLGYVDSEEKIDVLADHYFGVLDAAFGKQWETLPAPLAENISADDREGPPFTYTHNGQSWRLMQRLPLRRSRDERKADKQELNHIFSAPWNAQEMILGFLSRYSEDSSA